MTVTLLILLPSITSLLVSFRDPPNSLQLFVSHAFSSLICTTLVYFVLKSQASKTSFGADRDIKQAPNEQDHTWSLAKTLIWVLVVPGLVVMLVVMTTLAIFL